MRATISRRLALGAAAVTSTAMLSMADAPLTAHADELLITQTVTNMLTNPTNIGLGISSSGSPCSGPGFQYAVTNITQPNADVASGATSLANGHLYPVNVTLLNTGSCTWNMGDVVLSALSSSGAVNTPSTFWDNRAGSRWANDHQVLASSTGSVCPSSQSGCGNSSVTFSFNLLPDGDVGPGVHALSGGATSQTVSVPFALYDTGSAAAATCIAECPSGHIEFDAMMGVFFATWDSLSKDEAAVPIILASDSSTTVSLSFRNEGSAPWLPTDGTPYNTAVRLAAYAPASVDTQNPANSFTRCSVFADAAWVPSNASNTSGIGLGGCYEPEYDTQAVVSCSLQLSPPSTPPCTGLSPTDSNYVTFTFDLHAGAAAVVGSTYTECFWPRVYVRGLYSPPGLPGGQVGFMTPDPGDAQGACLTVVVV